MKVYCGDRVWYIRTITIKLCNKHFLFIRLLFVSKSDSSLTSECT